MNTQCFISINSKEYTYAFPFSLENAMYVIKTNKSKFSGSGLLTIGY